MEKEGGVRKLEMYRIKKKMTRTKRKRIKIIY